MGAELLKRLAGCLEKISVAVQQSNKSLNWDRCTAAAEGECVRGCTAVVGKQAGTSGRQWFLGQSIQIQIL